MSLFPPLMFVDPHRVQEEQAVMSRAPLSVYGLTIAISVIFVCAGLAPAEATPQFTTLHSFATPVGSSPYTNTDGSSPGAALVQGPDGSFYGSTEICGPSGNGTVFSITESGTLTTPYSFPITSTSGPNPYVHTDAQLVLGSDGNFYGTTQNGGTTGYGTVFQLTPSGTLTTLISFNTATGGGYPVGTLIEDGNGTFYGMTGEGGPSGNGTVYEVTTNGTASGTTLTTLHSFSAKDSHGDNSDGAGPVSGLVLGSGGNFYGTTYQGGANGMGTVFKITPTGTFTTLHSFAVLASGHNGDGAYPYAPLAVDSSGNLYGTAYEGGTSGFGTVFKVTSTGTFTTLVSFTNTNGANPESGLIQGFDGNFYGTTYAGGGAGDGTVFKITPSGVVTTLHGFTALSTTAPYGNADGANPITALVLGGDGNLYGTTRTGGVSGGGTVFEIEVESQALDSLNSGESPSATLTLGNNGDFFGTTSFGNNGSSDQYGSVFESTLLGVQTPRASFGNANYKSEGGYPTGSLAVDPDGNFYGENRKGGSSTSSDPRHIGYGTIYKMTPSGTVTPLFDFTGAYGGAPAGGLLRASDGIFYGTTANTIFKMTTDGTSGGTTLTNLADLPQAGSGPNGVIQGNDGNLYGTTSQGGTANDGTVFQMTPAGVLTTLYGFSGTADGANPDAGLVEGIDGNFYGTTYYGGAFNVGTLFLLSPPVAPSTTWTRTDFFDFPALGNTGDNANGANPEDVLIQGSDGAFYGTTRTGGAFGGGTVFKASRYLKLVGSPPRLVYVTDLTTLINFVPVTANPSPNGANGSNPVAGLALGPDGNFYGTTSAGGLDNDGAIYRLNGPPQCDPQIQSTKENTPLTFPIGFLDPSGIGIDTLSFPISPSHGTVQFVPGSFSETGTLGTGMVTYTPNAGFFGTDVFYCTVTGATGTSGAQPETVQVNQTPATVTVTPNPVTVQENAAQAFTATVKDAGGATFTPSSLTWSVSGGGTINAATGVFTTGATTGTFTVTATAMSGGVTKMGTASVTVVAGTPSVSASVSPSTLPVIGGTITISATANGGSSALTYYPIVEIYKNGTDTGQQFYLTTGNYSTGGNFSGTDTLGTNYDTSPATYTFTVSATNGNGTTTVTATGSTVQSNDTTAPVITMTGVSPSTLPVIGGMVTVSATVTDMGNNNTGLSYFPSVDIIKDGVDTGEQFYLNTTGIYTNGGGAFTGTYTIPENVDGTAHTYTFKITATDSVSPTPNMATATVGPVTQADDTTAPVITMTSVSPSTLPVIGGMITVSATVTDSGNNNTGLSYFPIAEIYKDSTATGQQFYLNTTGDYTTGGNFTGVYTIPENVDGTAHTYTFKITATDNVRPNPNAATATVGPVTQANDTTAPMITATGVSPATLPAGGGMITVSATVTDTGNNNTGLSYFPIAEVYKNGVDTGQQFYLNTTGDYTNGGGAFTGTFTAPANTDADYDEYTFVITATDNVRPTPNTTTVTAFGACRVATSQTQPVPTLTSISPSSAPINTAVTLTLTGTNFGYRSVVEFNGTQFTPTVLSATQLSASIPATALSGAGTVAVKVLNQGPGGGTSNAVSFTITLSPTVTSFTPTSGPVGTVVTVAGTNLNGVTAVRFHNANATVFSANGAGTQLTVTVPTGAGTGTFTITTPGGSIKTTGTFTVTVPPTVTSFTPTSGPVGTVVTVMGTNFNGVTAVRFHNANAVTFSANGTGTQLTVTVPTGAGTGTFTVTTPAGSVKTTGTFTVTTAPAPPTVTSFTPTSGPIGTVVTVTGTNLNGVTAVRFHNANATVFSANGAGTQLTVTVPNGAGTGTFTVTTPGGSIKTTGTFTVN